MLPPKMGCSGALLALLPLAVQANGWNAEIMDAFMSLSETYSTVREESQALMLEHRARLVLEYYDFLWSSVQKMDEAGVMVDLPPLMQLQIA